MSTIAAFLPFPAGFAAIISFVASARACHSPANGLCDRMLEDIGQARYREAREATLALNSGGERFSL